MTYVTGLYMTWQPGQLVEQQPWPGTTELGLAARPLRAGRRFSLIVRIRADGIFGNDRMARGKIHPDTCRYLIILYLIILDARGWRSRLPGMRDR